MGGGGLYGTAGDYVSFTQMILNEGRGNGHRVLKPETVAPMGQNHIGELNVHQDDFGGRVRHQRCRSLSPAWTRNGA